MTNEDRTAGQEREPDLSVCSICGRGCCNCYQCLRQKFKPGVCFECEQKLRLTPPQPESAKETES